MRSFLPVSLLVAVIFATIACDDEVAPGESDAVLQEGSIGEIQHTRAGVEDPVVFLEDELRAEQFDPNGVYADLPMESAEKIAAAAKRITHNYEGITNPKIHAGRIQRLLRDSLVADALVVARVTDKRQENRSGRQQRMVPWTVYEFEVSSVLHANRPVETFRVEYVGGEIDGNTWRTCTSRAYRLEHSYLVALKHHDQSDGMFMIDGDSAWGLDGDVIGGTRVTIDDIAAQLEVLK